MATIILLKADDIYRLTSLSGNIELDKLTPFMSIAQNMEIKRVLTDNLYNKILSDFDNDKLSGLYETIYNEFVVFLMVHYTAAHYLTNAAYFQSNGGLFKQVPENTESITKSEVDYLVTYQRNIGAEYELRFKEWMKKNYMSIPEYDSSKLNQNALKINWIL